MTSRWTRRGIVGLSAIAAALGSFAISSALTAEEAAPPTAAEPAGILEVDESPDSLLPFTSGHEPEVFSSDVSSLNHGAFEIEADGQTITVTPGPNGSVCYTAIDSQMRSNACFDAGTLRSGLAFGASQGPDKVIHVMGIVPDEVVSVHINGDVVSVDRNVWIYSAQVGDDLTFEVRSVDGAAIYGD